MTQFPKIIERKIGERFEMCKLLYEVRAACTCELCAFYTKDECFCKNAYKQYSGPCSAFMRSDNMDVIFVIVGESNFS